MGVVNEPYERRALCQRPAQTRYRLEEPRSRAALIESGGWQIGVALAQLGQEAAQLRQPHIAKQIVWRVLVFQSLAQGLCDRLVWESASEFKSPTTQKIGR